METITDFICAMFAPHADLAKTRIETQIVKPMAFDLVKTVKVRPEWAEDRGYLPKMLYGDDIRLKQILINLVKNALKFTFRGLIRISITFDESVDLLKVHVLDTGKGIEEADTSKLF